MNTTSETCARVSINMQCIAAGKYAGSQCKRWCEICECVSVCVCHNVLFVNCELSSCGIATGQKFSAHHIFTVRTVVQKH